MQPWSGSSARWRFWGWTASWPPSLNVFYLSGFNGIALHQADEPRPYAVVFSRHAPEHPILVIADYYLATFLIQPSWCDIRPFPAGQSPIRPGAAA